MKTKHGRFERIYQKADGTYLPDTSQPDPNHNFEITSGQYTPHKSTRYINVFIGANGIAQREDENGHLRDCNKDLPEIYADREECCGCSACYSVCQAGAICMLPDEEGFLYPVVDAEKCVRCFRCLSVCAFKKKEQSER